jgi:hypothetical protein
MSLKEGGTNLVSLTPIMDLPYIVRSVIAEPITTISVFFASIEVDPTDVPEDE